MAVSLSRSGELFAAGIDADVPNGKLIQLFRMSKVVTKREWMNFKAPSRAAMVIERELLRHARKSIAHKSSLGGKSSIYLWLRIEQAHSFSSSYLSTMPFKQFSKWNKQGTEDARRSRLSDKSIHLSWALRLWFMSMTMWMLLFLIDCFKSFRFSDLCALLFCAVGLSAWKNGKMLMEAASENSKFNEFC